MDGDFTIFVIQTRWPTGPWVDTDHDYFGHPKGFAASDSECWQKTRIRGTFDRKTAYEGFLEMTEKHSEREWRLVERHISCRTLSMFTYSPPRKTP